MITERAEVGDKIKAKVHFAYRTYRLFCTVKTVEPGGYTVKCQGMTDFFVRNHEVTKIVRRET